MMAPPCRSEERTCYRVFSSCPARRAPLVSLLGRRPWEAQFPGPQASALGPDRAGTSPSAPPSARFSHLSRAAAGPRPVRAARGPIVSPAPAGRRLRELEDDRRRCPPRRPVERVSRAGDAGGPGPSTSRTGFLLGPSEPLWGRGQGKFAPKSPLIYSKVWRRRVIFSPSSAYTRCVSWCLIPFPLPESIASLHVYL